MSGVAECGGKEYLPAPFLSKGESSLNEEKFHVFCLKEKDCGE